ncbi:hypothetical protein JHK87_037357 [Glycine soja]|nr:hypothetical protein JHK87_037357 [Glycine soja]
MGVFGVSKMIVESNSLQVQELSIEDVCLIAVRQKNTRYLFIRLESCVVLEIQVSQQSLINLNISLFRSQSHFPAAAAFGSLTRSNPHVYAVVTSDSKAATLLDLTQHDLDNSGDSANGNGDGGGGGGEGGGDNSKGEEGSDGDKRKMPLLMSQKFTLAYAALVGGGAERLIVDAAVELASQGHKVHVFTAHHDKNRCFEETVAGTFPVTVYGSFLPRHIFYHLHALCAYLRCLFVAFCVLFMWHSFDVILADQVSVVIPILKIKRSTKVVFYCHFPDLLLAQHSTFIRRMYRKPIDYAEEITTGIADLILVNSKFTASTFANTFKYLDAKGIRPAVLYPAVNVDQFNEPSSFKLNFLSINRFERKKNIQLAISAFAMLNSPEGVLKHKDITNASLTIVGASYWSLGLCCSAESAQSCSLCVNYLVWLCGAIISQTGGFDKRLKENVEYLEELKDLAEKEGVSNNIKFITSCSTAERNELLSECLCVLYTPKDEHFGIVPLEAMAAYKPVIACNSGGPVESIKNGVTGFLCDPTPLEFSLAMAKLISDPQEADNMGREARRHVVESFSTKSFGQHLNRYLVDIHRGKED